MKTNITFDEFAKLDLRIATIKAVELVENADKLYKITLDAGQELGERVIASGIRSWYSPEDLVGKQVIYLANLEPKTLRGVVSQGMLIASGGPTVGGSEQAVLLLPDKEVVAGSEIR
jgi:methionyl-tRNA synthetase